MQFHYYISNFKVTQVATFLFQFKTLYIREKSMGASSLHVYDRRFLYNNFDV